MGRILVVLVALLLCAALPAGAQTTSGSLTGNVVDANGAAVAGISVTVTDNATKKVRTTQTTEQGTFNVPQLEFGAYTLTINATGFKSYTATELKIDVGKEYSLNIVLQAGDVQESVTVVAGADVVNSTSGELSATVGERQIRELPLTGGGGILRRRRRRKPCP